MSDDQSPPDSDEVLDRKMMALLAAVESGQRVGPAQKKLGIDGKARFAYAKTHSDWQRKLEMALFQRRGEALDTARNGLPVRDGTPSPNPKDHEKQAKALWSTIPSEEMRDLVFAGIASGMDEAAVARAMGLKVNDLRLRFGSDLDGAADILSARVRHRITQIAFDKNHRSEFPALTFLAERVFGMIKNITLDDNTDTRAAVKQVSNVLREIAAKGEDADLGVARQEFRGDEKKPVLNQSDDILDDGPTIQ